MNGPSLNTVKGKMIEKERRISHRTSSRECVCVCNHVTDLSFQLLALSGSLFYLEFFRTRLHHRHPQLFLLHHHCVETGKEILQSQSRPLQTQTDQVCVCVYYFTIIHILL